MCELQQKTLLPWFYSTIHNCPCQLIEEQHLWGQKVCRIWLPDREAIVRVPRTSLRELDSSLDPEKELQRLLYVSAAAKVADVLEGANNSPAESVLLAPMESNVIPLPHQIHALSRAVSGDRVRYLLADEVGLGKTIEAGLIMRELKLRGLVRRVLVVAPKSLALQWISEMSNHFNEKFVLINPGELETIEKLEQSEGNLVSEGVSDAEYNPWLRFSQVIVTLDSVKPLSSRRGWSRERVQEYNQRRYERLVHAQWDLIIVDESHRLGGCTDQVARYKLGQGLAEAAPYLLLLSATPHQGKSDAFRRLMGLIDPMIFPDAESVTREQVAAHVIRTEKRNAITDEGKPLFLPRLTKTLKVDLSANQLQYQLYEKITAYVKKGYNQAVKDKKPHIGFLMVLLQRIAASSTYAIRQTLERRLQVLENMRTNNAVSSYDPEELQEMDAQELLDRFIEISPSGMSNEITQVNDLLEQARYVESFGPDTRALALLDLIYQLQGEENEAELKLLIFTEFVSTQEMLKKFLEDRGFACTTINGSMEMSERLLAQHCFRDHARIMISTDAGGEGLNLQFCHVIVNYDLPWNPMRIEQRIGRVDRIGQNKIVRAINFTYANSVEDRVREVLETKLGIILAEMGVDKTSDVLDTALSGEVFERMMSHVIMGESDPAEEVEKTLTQLREELSSTRNSCPVYGVSEIPDMELAARLRGHPLPHWVERMTVNFVRLKGGTAEKNLADWKLLWPDGEQMSNINLNMENNRIRALAQNLPQIFSACPVPCLTMKALSLDVSGLWALFEIRLLSAINPENRLIRIPVLRRRYLCVFLNHDNQVFMPTARHIWDCLQSNVPKITGSLSAEESISAMQKMRELAEKQGLELFESLKQEHSDSIIRERKRSQIAFSARRKAISRLGLPEVRHYRLLKCEAEEKEWQRELDAAQKIMPEIRLLSIFYLQNSGATK